jgi:hypothetical protein
MLKKLDRTVENGEVRSSYDFGNLTVRLTSRFSDKGNLEDALYDIALQQLRSQKNREGRQRGNGHADAEAV